ncbi:MAG: nucleotidyltransferase domain-containing protein [bacterium]|nr:nucleotidyltransferase domain-containing protein [bacterium]
MKVSVYTDKEQSLILAREIIFKRLEVMFQGKAVEAHVFGSVARGDADAFSDIDIWFTFNDADFEEAYENRFEYYRKTGSILHSCEAPQNAPSDGVHTALLIEEDNKNIVVVDIYLCPLSTAYITDDGKKLFGVDLPKGSIGFNPKKVQVDENYRIDFFIGFIFNSIKKLARNIENPLKAVLYEYQNKFIDSNIAITPLVNKEQNLETLELIIENIHKIANDKQKEVLVTISAFARRILL